MTSNELGFRQSLIRRALFIACVGTLMAASGCSRNIQVRTVAAPGANFAGRRTFRMLPAPQYRGTTPLAANDPMLVNSITYRALRDEIRRAFESRGYRFSPTSADLDIAAYATAGRKLDIRTFDYGIDWRGFPRQYVDVYEYEQGTVIIDVIDPTTHQLLWRGQGVAAVSEDPNKFIAELRKAVDAIVAKFPPAS
jgi:hypothetical protein